MTEDREWTLEVNNRLFGYETSLRVGPILRVRAPGDPVSVFRRKNCSQGSTTRFRHRGIGPTSDFRRSLVKLFHVQESCVRSGRLTLEVVKPLTLPSIPSNTTSLNKYISTFTFCSISTFTV